MKTLVIGYGNPSRNDDGVGWHVVAALQRLHLPCVAYETAHQLEVDFAEAARDYDIVVFVDASLPESPAPWRQEEVTPVFRVMLSHIS